MPTINSSAPPQNLSSTPAGISTKSPVGGTLYNTSPAAVEEMLAGE